MITVVYSKPTPQISDNKFLHVPNDSCETIFFHSELRDLNYVASLSV